MLAAAIAQIPPQHRRRILITCDEAGATIELLQFITTLNTRSRRAHYSVGFDLDERARTAITALPADAWSCVLDDAGQARPLDKAGAAELTGLRVGGERLELACHGPNHSPDNIFVYAPKQETLMVVDVLYPGWVPFKNLAVSQNIPGWLQAHATAMSYPWRTLVGGHLGRLGTRADGHLQQRYLADLQTSVRDTISSLDPAPFFAKYDPAGNAWAIFAGYLNAVAQQAAAPVIATYLGTLAAADVFTKDNAFSLLESLRIDTGLLGPFGIRP
ncbi:hypothetical protein GCM10022419_106330 [Nonomuraea rosea]|uniref:MBL fold metallo-hydrolase n=1 Tax=Nonomuraea rosea TaxID=638574 RepID=A0ABP6ZF30_9ACTN